MGMYTSVRFKGIVKEEFVSLIKEMVDENLDWIDLVELYPDYNFLKVYSELHRANFIPHGVLFGAPDEWDSLSLEPYIDRFYFNFNEVTRLWSFQCSVINSGNIIESFFDIIASKIIEEPVHIEFLEEPLNRSKMYKLEKGKLILLEDEGIEY